MRRLVLEHSTNYAAAEGGEQSAGGGMCIYSMTAAAAAPWRLSRDQPDLRKDLKTAAWSGCLRACLTPLLASSHPLAYQVFPAAIRGRSLTSRAEVTAWCVLLCEAVLPAQRSLRSSDRDWKRFLLQSERDLHPKKPLALASRCQGQ